MRVVPWSPTELLGMGEQFLLPLRRLQSATGIFQLQAGNVCLVGEMPSFAQHPAWALLCCACLRGFFQAVSGLSTACFMTEFRQGHRCLPSLLFPPQPAGS